jgi:hypothetical protein
MCDAGGPLGAAWLDNGTFPWYKQDNGDGVKLLILLALCRFPDNHFLSARCLTKTKGQQDKASVEALN